MPRRPATVTQADVARTIRAMMALGLPVVRVVVRPDGGVSVETTASEIEAPAPPPELVDENEVIPL